MMSEKDILNFKESLTCIDIDELKKRQEELREEVFHMEKMKDKYAPYKLFLIDQELLNRKADNK